MRLLSNWTPVGLRRGRRPDQRRVIRPDGQFRREQGPAAVTEHGPDDCTSINSEQKRPVLSQMVYIRPA
jgi:hypothetical protein